MSSDQHSIKSQLMLYKDNEYPLDNKGHKDIYSNFYLCGPYDFCHRYSIFSTQGKKTNYCEYLPINIVLLRNTDGWSILLRNINGTSL